MAFYRSRFASERAALGVAIEEPGQVLRGDRPARVPDLEAHLAALAGHVQQHAAARGREPEGVLEDVAQDLPPQDVRVRDQERRGALRHHGRERDPVARGLRGVGLLEARGEMPDVDLLDPQTKAGRLHPADLEELLDAAAERAGLRREGRDDVPDACGELPDFADVGLGGGDHQERRTVGLQQLERLGRPRPEAAEEGVESGIADEPVDPAPVALHERLARPHGPSGQEGRRHPG